MVAASVRELRGGNIQNALPGPLRNEVHDASQILVGIPEAHTPADTALKVAGAAAEEESDHALVLVPDIHRPVQFRHVGLQRKPPQKAVPEGFELRKSGLYLSRSGKSIHHPEGLGLVDEIPGRAGNDGPFVMPGLTGHLKLLLWLVLHIPQHKNELLRGAGRQGYVETVRSNGAPPMRHGIAGLTCQHLKRCFKSVIHTQEGFPVRIEAVEGPVHTKEGIMVPAFAVFRLVVDDIPLHFHFSGGKVALEILHIRRGIPQAPFGKRVQLDALGRRADVGKPHAVHLAAVADGDEEKDIGLYAVPTAFDAGITHTMPALIALQRRFARFPAGIPHAVSVLYIIIPASGIHGDAVIAVAQDAAEFGILAEAIAAGSVGNEGEEILRTHVVDPRPRRIRPGYHIFAGSVVKMSECLHCCPLFSSVFKYTHFHAFFVNLRR